MEAKEAMEAKTAYEEKMRKEKETLEEAMAEAQSLGLAHPFTYCVMGTMNSV